MGKSGKKWEKWEKVGKSGTVWENWENFRKKCSITLNFISLLMLLVAILVAECGLLLYASWSEYIVLEIPKLFNIFSNAFCGCFLFSVF